MLGQKLIVDAVIKALGKKLKGGEIDIKAKLKELEDRIKKLENA